MANLGGTRTEEIGIVTRLVVLLSKFLIHIGDTSLQTSMQYAIKQNGYRFCFLFFFSQFMAFFVLHSYILWFWNINSNFECLVS